MIEVSYYYQYYEMVIITLFIAQKNSVTGTEELCSKRCHS